jgi:amino acid transporter
MTETTTSQKGMTVWGAMFLGIGAMVGAGIFALLGEAGAVAGSAVWISFLIAGIVALFQGYSFAKLGARFPSRGGSIHWLTLGFGNGHLTGITSWMIFASVLITSAMVAVTFGNYGAGLFQGNDFSAAFARFLSIVVVVAMTFVNLFGSKFVNKSQTYIVVILLVVLSGFAVILLTDVDLDLLARSTYPSNKDILSSVALTFFAYLGFSVVAFTGGDLPNPGRDIPRAMYLSIGISILTYVAIAIGVFGTLPLEEVLANGDTALAAAAEPKLGDAGYSLMAIAALLATSSSLIANLYAADGAAALLARNGQFPPIFGRKLERGWPVGLIIAAALVLVLALAFDLTAIASLGSAVALAVFFLVTISHVKLRQETGAKLWLLGLAALTTAVTLVAFAINTYQDEPQTFVAMIAIFVLAIAIDLVWKRIRGALPTMPDAEVISTRETSQ